MAVGVGGGGAGGFINHSVRLMPRQMSRIADGVVSCDPKKGP